MIDGTEEALGSTRSDPTVRDTVMRTRHVLLRPRTTTPSPGTGLHPPSTTATAEPIGLRHTRSRASDGRANL